MHSPPPRALLRVDKRGPPARPMHAGPALSLSMYRDGVSTIVDTASGTPYGRGRVLGRGVVIAVVLAASAAVAAPSAQAATPRYAAPAAQGAGDCGTPGNACPISTA